MSQDDRAYFAKRALAERVMASAARRDKVREIHEEMARRYDELGLADDCGVELEQQPHEPSLWSRLTTFVTKHH